MITWSFRAGIAGFALTVLAGCEDGQGGGLLDGLATAAAPPNVALSQADLAFGAVTLVPPRGFCIDKRSLRQRFALMARCDKLGAPSAAAGAPIGIITASVSAAGTSGLPSPEQTALAFQLESTSAVRTTDSSVIFRATGGVPSTELSTTHWRGSARMGSQVVGLALYGPEDGRAVSSEGRAILRELIDRSTDAAGG
ncbi:MAG: hypothetical protein AB8B60_00375 [Sulfitobacter sp.]